MSRRQTIAIAAAMLAPVRALAADPVGIALAADGGSMLHRAQARWPLEPDMPLFQDDTIRTAADGFAALRLVTEATINLGAGSEITLDAFTAALGGTLTLNGGMVFDRPDDLPPADHMVLTAFAQIGVRGTKFFAGPSNGPFAVFAARGTVLVDAQGERRTLQLGEGVDVAADGTPGAVRRWSEARIAAAYASVGL